MISCRWDFDNAPSNMETRQRMENHGSGYAKPNEHFDYLDPPDVLRGGGVRLMA